VYQKRRQWKHWQLLRLLLLLAMMVWLSRA
jgi:hypothetical protein